MMNMEIPGIERFLDAQKGVYDTALEEIKNGYKESHWMWFIFPQIRGLGFSPTAQYFAIKNEEEAEEYVQHPILYSRLLEISNALMEIENNDPAYVMGYPDDLKLKSSMTLFHWITNNEIFKMVLDKFFDGELDELTIQILEKDMDTSE